MNKLQSEIQSQLVSARYALERVCDRRWLDRLHEDHPRNNQRAFHDLVEACDKLERQHMRFGSRMLGYRPSRNATHGVRVSYFVVHLLACEDMNAISWERALDMREDWRIAFGIQRAIGRGTFRRAIQDANLDLQFIDQIDYSDHLAGK